MMFYLNRFISTAVEWYVGTTFTSLFPPLENLSLKNLILRKTHALIVFTFHNNFYCSPFNICII